jgi:hypothetical protein
MNAIDKRLIIFYRKNNVLSISLIILTILLALFLSFYFKAQEDRKIATSESDWEFEITRLRFVNKLLNESLTSKELEDYFAQVCNRADLEMASINPPICYTEINGVKKSYSYIWVEDKLDFFQKGN